ncbi:MAG: AAA family ATPase [Planctomycetes bacterium]|nr:AAA family ATPase [Planctomycetota bacterium]
MSRSPDDHDVASDAKFRDLLEQCQELFRSCALDYAEQNPELIQGPVEPFVERMLNLHRGLVLKVFVEMAQADQRVSSGELRLAGELLAHAWGRRLDETQVKETLRHYADTTNLRWDSLLWPFERLSTFRRRSSELFALVQRLALVIAQVNRRVDPRALEHLQWIIKEMQVAIEPVPLAAAPPPVSPRSTNPYAEKRAGDFELGQQHQFREAAGVRFLPGGGQEQVDDVLRDLDVLIGLDSIKQEMRELVHFLKMQEERTKHDLPQTAVSLHAVFTGNPGTGKTTVARLFGRILGAMGILARGHLIETDRSGLVAEYAGQTGPKTNLRVNEALDGVLFIDEAYSLVAERGDDPYGMEALQTLLKRMEDDRKRLVVVLAGYPRPMTALLDTNPGLSSRFNRVFAFPDYTAVELGRIFETMSQRDLYELPSRTRAKLLLGFRHLLDRRDERFGNGRLARNVYEHSVRRLAGRLAKVTPLTRELLTTLEHEDVVLEGVPESVWNGLDGEDSHFQLRCPSCEHTSRLRQKYLGCQVKCRGCQHAFCADWAEPE